MKKEKSIDRTGLLPEMLAIAVPLYIQQLVEKGGPTGDDFKEANKLSAVLGERGDVLLFGGGKKGEAAEMFNGVARAIACLSFVAGGVTLFGNHWESKL